MENQNLTEAIYRLTKENNEMLRSMRRSAFLGGVFKIVMYLAFILVPIWYYQTYLAGTVQALLQTSQQLQGAGASVSAQGSGLLEQLKQLESLIPGALDRLQQASSTAR